MIAEEWEPVFARDKRGTRLRGDHAKKEAGITVRKSNKFRK
jgi:hypothetical protein